MVIPNIFNRFIRTTFTTLLFLLGFAYVGTAEPATALSGSQFNAGRIIDDQLFFDGDTMSASQIQSFLNAKVPNCDSNGDLMHNGMLRRDYAANNGVSTPFICLKDFKQNTPSRPSESGLCSGLSAKSNRTAAQIIDDVAKACGVSEKVLLVLLQKEQSLITDDWPWPIQYRSATGYGCPDGAPCDSDYYGFFNQVYMAARQYKRYAADPTHYNHRFGFNNSVRYHPNISCGSSTVYIENQATAGLYNYTPYQPNNAALNNLYGEGNGCSSYGNRNFWRMYNDWFGTTTYKFNARVTTGVTLSPGSPSKGENVTATIVIKNYEDYEVHIGGTIKVAGRDPNGKNADFIGANNFAIPPNSTYTITDSQKLNSIGKYRFWIASYREGYGWSKSWPANTNSSIVRSVNTYVSTPNVRVTTGLNTSPSAPVQGQDISANFVVKNYENYPVKMDVLKAAARGPDGKNFDFPGNYNVVIPAKSTYSYTESQRLDKPGDYDIWIVSYGDDYGWSNTYPTKTNSSIIKSIDRKVDEANIRVTTSLSATPSPAGSGQVVTASFIVKNYETEAVTIPVLKVAARGPSNKNVDFRGDYYITIPAKSTYTYSETQSFSQPGIYNLWIASFRGWSGWSNDWPVKTNSTIIKSVDLTINP